MTERATSRTHSQQTAAPDAFETYSTYNSAKVPWAQRLPEHWKFCRAKFLFHEMDRPVRDSDEVITVFRDGTVTLRKNRRTEGYTFSTKEVGYQGIREGDLVIHSMDVFAGAVGISDSDGKGSPVYIVCRPKRDLDPRYYAYLLQHLAECDYITALGQGIRQRSVDFGMSTFGEMVMPRFDVEEQTAIADFLDKQTRLVDDLIVKKEQLIELLEERRTALITKTVTKGLDPDATMKESGIKWVKEIPKHWEVLPLKRLIAEPITDGPHETPKFLNDGIPFLSVDGIQNGELNFKGCRYISETAHKKFSQKCGPTRDDILIGKAASIGKIARVKVDFEFSVWSPLALICPDERIVRPEFLEYALRSAVTQAQIDVLSTSNTQRNLSMRDIPRLVICFPGLQEQRATANFLDQETEKIDALVTKVRQAIDRLKEYRSALITAAVTGKIDVRDQAA